MFFEGTEKKVELIIRGANLRAKPETFWRDMVSAAGAKIISKMSNEVCDAYLLSESSLFVWNERLTMITCGTTTLIDAARFFFAHVPPDAIDFFTYVRKNEYFPEAQRTDFANDAEILRQSVPGKVYHFGLPGEHRMFVYHFEKQFSAGSHDGTLEVSMHNFEPATAALFNCEPSLEGIREKISLENSFPGFEIDDFLFHPRGYSLNAIRGLEYYTIHVTPEEANSYVSFVTNVHLRERTVDVIRSVLGVFRPRAFDVITFHPARGFDVLDIAPFQRSSSERRLISGEFEAGFTHYKALPLEG